MSRNSAWNRMFSLKCPDCGGMIKEKDIICPHCGANLDEPIVQDQFSSKSETTQIKKGTQNFGGGNQELADYVMTGAGLGRLGLNLMCFIGVFIFGWLLAVAFDMLGKKRLGWFYVVPVIAGVLGSRFIAPEIGILAIIIYVIGWVHANLILSRYQSSARERIAQIKRLPGDQLTIDVIMEKGILQQKVLANKESATSTLVKALEMPGGDGQLLNLAGVALFANKRFAEAKQFFGRAMSSVEDNDLAKQIKLNLANAEKKLK